MTNRNGSALGHPRVHARRLSSTNDRARALAIAGAPHGTLVSAEEQTAGRGRQGRAWCAPPGSSLLMSVVLRDPPRLLSLLAAVAVCEAIGDRAGVKWPNDIVVERPSVPPASAGSPGPELAKLGGILVEGRPQEGWAVLGIGVNVAVSVAQLPPEVRERAASLERPPGAIEPLLADLLTALGKCLVEPTENILDAWRARDALLGRDVLWAHGRGSAQGVDACGRLIVGLPDGTTVALDAGEVHLGRA